MGRQSSRLIYRGKDIKDLVYRGNFLNKLYKGNDLVWEKLYRYFVNNGNLAVFDLVGKKYVSEAFPRYSIFNLKKGPTHAIANMYDMENKRDFFAISYDMLHWKEVKELEFKYKVDEISVNYQFMASYGGFFVYERSKNNTLYFVEIDYGLEYTVKEVYSSNVFFFWVSQYGVSEYFYGIQFPKAYTYILNRIGKDGKVEAKQLMGNFTINNVNMFEEGGSIIADGIGNAYIISPNVVATNGGTYISKVQNMDTENIYTAFYARMTALNGALCEIDILYDSYQTLFLAHRGFVEEEKFVEGKTGRDGYYNMLFYQIDNLGRVLPVYQKKDLEIKVRCYGVPGRSYITIVFGGRPESSYKGPVEDGIIYFYKITKGISSSRTPLDLNSVVFDYDKTQYENAFVGQYFWGRYYIIFIDNLFFNESEGNFIAAID